MFIWFSRSPDGNPTTNTWHITQQNTSTPTYDHRIWKIRDPVRSPPFDKPDTAGLVVGSVTTSEYLVFYIITTVSETVTIVHYLQESVR
ncbi:hypothetical protein F4813DRAFT_197170 [Daldinia decipiens]|uniref:uncharacterized protein n=1 Tax=Daldinia decipiens TaxID=326647 RepID=UPI0020C224D5|nr:uncharacterized protein F4813DRAFT_197170 [Daldinia decipiens]KAI1654833.1 hypothetical protein F4813DRAFT_197170 [Daldinia decipiens]